MRNDRSKEIKRLNDRSKKIKRLNDRLKKLKKLNDCSEKIKRLNDRLKEIKRLNDRLKKLKKLNDCSEKIKKLNDCSEKIKRLNDCPEKIKRLRDRPEKIERLNDRPEKIKRLNDRLKKLKKLIDHSEKIKRLRDHPEKIKRLNDRPETIKRLIARYAPLHGDELILEDCTIDPMTIPQSQTGEITHDQLATQVRDIYAGLVMVEAKGIDVDERQAATAFDNEATQRARPTDQQWKSLIDLHKVLLHKHHDFFLASQHPSASLQLKKLSAMYKMPQGTWHYCIDTFLGFLHHQLPDSSERMLAFISIAYSMTTLLFETVPMSEDTWIECLGDLGRYRMALEDDKPHDKETFESISRYWYQSAEWKPAHTSRLFAHLQILTSSSRVPSHILDAASTALVLEAGILRQVNCGSGLVKADGMFRRPIRLKDLYPCSMNCNGLAWPFNGLRNMGRTFAMDSVNDSDIHAPELLPRDYVLDGQTDHHHDFDDDERTRDMPFMGRSRNLRVLWLSYLLWFLTVISSMWGVFWSKWKNRRSQIRLSLRLHSGILFFAIPAVSARPVEPAGRSSEGKSATAEDLSSMIISPLAHLVVGAGILSFAHLLAKRHQATIVYGFLMANFAFAWSLIRADTSASLISQFTVFGLWLACATQYASSAFQKRCSIGSAMSMTIVASVFLDLAITSFMQSTHSSVSVLDMLSLLPASVSLALGLLAGAFTFLRQIQDPDPQIVGI